MRARMERLGRSYDQVVQFSQESELRRFERDRRLAAARLDGAQRQKWQVERDIVNVRAVIAAAKSFGDLMAEVAQDLSLQSARRKEAA
jgi:hypothetical protein